MKARIGPMLIVLGISILLIATAIGLATVTYLTFLSCRPAGTSVDPAGILTGETINLYMCVDTKLDPTKTYCRIRGIEWTYDVTIQLPDEIAIYTYYYQSLDPHWVVPDAPVGTKFQLDWHHGEQVLHTSYAEIIEIGAYFTINGIVADEETHIVVQDPTLAIAFIAQNHGDEIITVYVFVYDEAGTELAYVEFTETVTDQKWESSYTLPDKGIYRLDGFFGTFTQGPFQRMSCLIPYGIEDWIPSKDFLPAWHPAIWLGLVTTGFGIIVTAVEAKKKK